MCMYVIKPNAKNLWETARDADLLFKYVHLLLLLLLPSAYGPQEPRRYLKKLDGKGAYSGMECLSSSQVDVEK